MVTGYSCRLCKCDWNVTRITYYASGATNVSFGLRSIMFVSFVMELFRMRTQAGEEILYVGDHLYSDVLRSKRTLGWRTTLIVPELTKEMIAFRENRELHHQIIQLRKLRDDMNSYADELKRLPLTPETEKKMMDLEDDDWKVKSVLTTLTDRYHKAFHPVWGQMFVAGYQDSRFAFYVENYACLYTAKASNLGVRSSPERAFRTSAEMLPHDKIISDRTTVLEEFDD